MISEILPGQLYVSDEWSAVTYQELDTYQIHTLLRLDRDCLVRTSWVQDPRRRPLLQHLVDGSGNHPSAFVRAAVLGVRAIQRHETPLLVYCMAGQNRSPLICAFILVYLGYQSTVDEALAWLHTKRPVVNLQSEIRESIRIGDQAVLDSMKRNIEGNIVMQEIEK